jgi:hypothetical protein
MVVDFLCVNYIYILFSLVNFYKGKVSLMLNQVPHHEDVRASVGMTPHIPNLGAR